MRLDVESGREQQEPFIQNVGCGASIPGELVRMSAPPSYGAGDLGSPPGSAPAACVLLSWAVFTKRHALEKIPIKTTVDALCLSRCNAVSVSTAV